MQTIRHQRVTRAIEAGEAEADTYIANPMGSRYTQRPNPPQDLQLIAYRPQYPGGRRTYNNYGTNINIANIFGKLSRDTNIPPEDINIALFGYYLLMWAYSVITAQERALLEQLLPIYGSHLLHLMMRNTGPLEVDLEATVAILRPLASQVPHFRHMTIEDEMRNFFENWHNYQVLGEALCITQSQVWTHLQTAINQWWTQRKLPPLVLPYPIPSIDEPNEPSVNPAVPTSLMLSIENSRASPCVSDQSSSTAGQS